MSANRVEEVMSCFQKGVNCSQAIILVYGQDLGVDRDTCLNIASVFGGGINRTGNVCGAVTGALMAIGLKYHKVGTNKFFMGIEIPKSHEIGQEFTKKFEKRNGTIICREIIGLDSFTDENIEQAFKTDAFKKCMKCVQDAAEILEELL
ncbi:MAG: C-GCAxxG-C-C family protein [Candidatus Thorarchaeota archaeon]